MNTLVINKEDLKHNIKRIKDYAKKGLIPKESADRYINMAWKFVQKWAKKVIK